jgi:Tol biopolymer transport system component
MFGTSADGSRLVFGRMLGAEQGQIILRDRERGSEAVLASHQVRGAGGGSFWPQVSPDGARVIYRTQFQGLDHYVVATAGGTPRQIPRQILTLASDWSHDGRRIIGECAPLGQICEYLPDKDSGRPILADPSGAQLLYPSFSWDDRWVAFMRRQEGRTRIMVTPVRDDGSLAGSDAWIPISSDDVDGARPRFTPDGATLFYLETRGNVMILVRQPLDPKTKRPVGVSASLAGVQNIPQSVFNIGLQNVLTVTRDRLFYNTAEVRANVWTTRIE